MELKELSHEQQVALVALVEAVTLADGTVSEADEEEIGRLAGELGEDTYRELLDEAERRFHDIGALKKFLARIKDQGVRELIHGTVLEETMIDPPASHPKSELMAWLAETWNIKIEMGNEGE